MRVLIADRNAWLLESISRTFAARFSIQTATTHQHCNALLLRGRFDLVVISEKLADGPGLRLLAQLARNSPDTLRVFAARAARLQLLKGKLAPFGLLCALAYPLDPQELLSVLAHARAGLENDWPAAPAAPDVSVLVRRAREVHAIARGAAPPPVPEQHPVVPRPVPNAARPAVERISLSSADAIFSTNVPMTVASIRKIRRSNLPPPRPAPVARQVPPVSSRARRVQHTGPQTAPSQAAATATTPRVPSQGAAFQRALERRRTGNRVVGAGQVVSRPAQRGRARRSPVRTKVVLGASIAALFLATTLILNLMDSSVHVTQASASRPEIKRSDTPALPPSPAPISFPQPVQAAAQRLSPKPDAVKPDLKPDVEPIDPQVAASATPPIADPSTFSSEAYEPIYSN